MLLTDYNKTAIKDNITTKISNATGITNLSESSKIRNIADILLDDVFTFTKEVGLTIGNIHEETATGKYLELLGTKHGTYKHQNRELAILAQDQVFKIEPINPLDTFASLFPESRFIYAGEEIRIASGVSIRFIDTIELRSDSENVFISVNVLTNEFADINLTEGNKIKLIGLSDLGESANGIVVSVEKTLSVPSFSDTEEEFRKRIIASKNSRKDVAVLSAIENTLRSVPGKIEYLINNNEGGPGKINILFITQVLKQGLSDPGAESIKNFIHYKLRSVITDGIDYTVEIPTRLEVFLTYEYTSDITIDRAVFKYCLSGAFKDKYVYGRPSGILVSDMEAFVKLKLPSLTTFNITNVSLFDQSTSLFINSGNHRILEPKGTYITYSPEIEV